MRILIVEPRYWYYTGKSQSHFPLGPAYVGASLIQAGHYVEGIDCNHIEGDFDHVADMVLDRFSVGSFDLFAMGGLCITFEFQRRLFSLVREKIPGVILVSGGNMLSSEPEICLNEFRLDFGVIGEGEITSRELCNMLESGGYPENVNGIIFKKDGRAVLTPPRKGVKNLDEVAFPEWELFDSKENIKNSGTMAVFTSRSCPFHCTFCFHSKNNYYRKRSVSNVIKELKELQSKYDIKKFGICDELFVFDKKWIIEFSEAIKENGLTFTGACQMRATDADPGVLERLKEIGFTSVSIGFESGSNTILRSMRKKITVEQSEKAINMVRGTGLPVTGGIIIGDFEETPETIQATVSFITRNKLVPVSDLVFVVPYPGSEIYKRSVEAGLIADKLEFLSSLSYFAKLRVNMTQMADEVLISIQEQASMDIYKYFIENCSGKILDTDCNSSESSSIQFQCWNCGLQNMETITGISFEILRYCPDCAHPVYFNPLHIPHIDQATKRFQDRIKEIIDNSTAKIMITPVGLMFMRLSQVIGLPVDRISGFLDNSPERLKHQFMGRDVYLRNLQTIEKLRPDMIITCSVPFQRAIMEELDSLDMKDTELLPVFNMEGSQ